MTQETKTLILLHTAVFLAGWTGIFGRLIALRVLSAFTVNLAYNLEPVYSIAFAALLFGEYREVGLSFWLGIALIVCSVLIQTRRVV